jgi:hypothetical protein
MSTLQVLEWIKFYFVLDQGKWFFTQNLKGTSIIYSKFVHILQYFMFILFREFDLE